MPVALGPVCQACGTGVATPASSHGCRVSPSSANVQCSVNFVAARLAAGEDGGGVAILDVAPALDLDLDRHRGRLGRGVEPGDPDPLDLWPSHDEPSAAGGVARVEELSDRLAVRDRPQPGVVAVDRLGPGGDRPARGHLEHVGREPAVGEAQVERGGVGVAAEVEVGDFGDLRVFGDRVLHGALDQRLVAQRGVVGPRGRDDRVVDRMHALGALLDRDEHPAAVSAAEGPELSEADGFGSRGRRA